jgi:hypothetical protein
MTDFGAMLSSPFRPRGYRGDPRGYINDLGYLLSISLPLDGGDCVVIGASAINTVMPAEAGIQNLLKILDSVSRFACTE